jgi:hypothetical protein
MDAVANQVSGPTGKTLVEAVPLGLGAASLEMRQSSGISNHLMTCGAEHAWS